MLSYWWRVPREPVVEGAAVRPRVLWKTLPLFEWEILTKDEMADFERKGRRLDSVVAAKSLDGVVEGKDVELYDPFAGLPDPRRPLVATPKRGKSIKAVSWADLEIQDEDVAR
jgi:hypothetical protein